MRFLKHKGLTINKDFLPLLSENELDSFDSLMSFSAGELETEKRGRSVVRFSLASLEIDGSEGVLETEKHDRSIAEIGFESSKGGLEGELKKSFYLKRHTAAAKTSLSARLRGVIKGAGAEDALNEWEMTLLLLKEGFSVPMPVAYGERKDASLTLTEELYNAVRVEDYLPRLSDSKTGFAGVLKKRRLIKKLGSLAGDFHQKGFNHRDFYLGHFFINPDLPDIPDTNDTEIFILDLQRVQRRKNPVKRWVLKDLSQLAFSASITENISSTDMMRFAYAYFGVGKLSSDNKSMIREVLGKVARIASHTEKLLAKRKKRVKKIEA
jgi:heptose I phosphotransferase